METKTRTLHFTIAENAGRLLMQIAQEHLLYGFNPSKAIKAITNSLSGCPMYLALSILIGEKVIEVDVENQTFNVVDREDQIHSDYPKINPISWYKREHEKIGEEGRMLYAYIGSALRQSITSLYGFEKQFDFGSILDFISGNHDSVLRELESDFAVKELKDLILVVKRFIETANAKYAVMDWLELTYPKYFRLNVSTDPSDYYSKGRHQVIDMLDTRIKNLIGKRIKQITSELEEEDDEVRGFIKAQTEISKKLSEKIKPNPITDLNNAGWIAPNGDFYGLDGTIANMLHNQIADKLAEDGIITVPAGEHMAPDTYMREEGWITVHNGHILYDGYFYGKEITKEQQHAMYLYGQHYTVKTRKAPLLGIEKTPVTGVRIKSLDKIALRKMFDLYS